MRPAQAMAGSSRRAQSSSFATSAGMTNERIAFVRATGLTKIHDGGGDATEDITVHEVPCAEAPAWLARKMAEGLARRANPSLAVPLLVPFVD